MMTEAEQKVGCTGAYVRRWQEMDEAREVLHEAMKQLHRVCERNFDDDKFMFTVRNTMRDYQVVVGWEER